MNNRPPQLPAKRLSPLENAIEIDKIQKAVDLSTTLEKPLDEKLVEYSTSSNAATDYRLALEEISLFPVTSTEGLAVQAIARKALGFV